MKVIKDNYNKFPREVTCERCDSVIELENEDDLKYDGCGEFYWLCPLCMKTNYVEDFNRTNKKFRKYFGGLKKVRIFANANGSCEPRATD